MTVKSLIVEMSHTKFTTSTVRINKLITTAVSALNGPNSIITNFNLRIFKFIETLIAPKQISGIQHKKNKMT